MISPNDLFLREEFQKLVDEKKGKENKWYSQMKGFYNQDKITELEQQDEDENLLKEKFSKRFYGENND